MNLRPRKVLERVVNEAIIRQNLERIGTAARSVGRLREPRSGG